MHRSAAERRLTGLGSVDIQLTGPGRSTTGGWLGWLAFSGSVLFPFFFFSPALPKRGPCLSRCTHTLKRLDVERERE